MVVGWNGGSPYFALGQVSAPTVVQKHADIMKTDMIIEIINYSLVTDSSIGNFTYASINVNN